MMTAMLIATATLLQPPDAVAALTVNVPERVRVYLERCEAAYLARLESLEKEVDQLAAQPNQDESVRRRLESAREQWQLLKHEPAPLLPLVLPTKRDEVGCLSAASYADPAREHAVDVLEVVDNDDVIVRAWYDVPAGDGAAALEPDAERTFVDLWIRGVDTTDMTAGSPTTLEQVFWVSGEQAFDTDCGKRILPKLEPLEVEGFRSRGNEE